MQIASGAITCVLLWGLINVHAVEINDTCSLIIVEYLSTARPHLAHPLRVTGLQITNLLHRSDAIAFLHPLGNGVLHPDEDTLHVGSCDHPDERTLFPQQTSVRMTA